MDENKKTWQQEVGGIVKSIGEKIETMEKDNFNILAIVSALFFFNRR